MTLSHNKYSYAVFPFLKTSGPVHIGRFIFRSTDDTENLSDEQSATIKEIASMLFVQDNLQIKSASYAIIPFIDFNRPEIDLNELTNVQNVVAYIYASPRHEFGDIFLSYGHASMAILSPTQVSKFLVYP
jgi:hypothetical protein